jgi:hypothetical protein
MGRPLPTSNMPILVAPASLLSDCFFATSTMFDRLRGLEQASQRPLPLRGEGGRHGRRSPWHEAHPARPHQGVGSWIPAVAHPPPDRWLSSIANNEDIQQLISAQALLPNVFQGVYHEYRVACYAPIS